MRRTVGFSSALALCAICAISLASLFLRPRPALAAMPDESESGYELRDGASVEIAFGEGAKRIQGYAEWYEITFDKAHIFPVENKNEVFDKLKATFVENDFDVKIVKAGRLTARRDYPTRTDRLLDKNPDANGYERPAHSKPDRRTFFYEEYDISFPTPFSDILKPDGAPNDWSILGRTYERCLELGVPESEIIFKYVYMTPYGAKRLTTDADDSTEGKNGERLHEYRMTVANRDRAVNIRQRIPDQNAWYLIALGAGAATAAVPAAIAANRRRGKKGERN